MANWLIVERIDKEEWPKFEDKHCHSCDCELEDKEAACLHIFLDEFPRVEFLCCSCAYLAIKEDVNALQVALELTRRLKGVYVRPDDEFVPEEKKPVIGEITLDVPDAGEPKDGEAKEKEATEKSEEAPEKRESEEVEDEADADNLEIAEPPKEDPAEK